MSSQKHWVDAYAEELNGRAETLERYHDNRGAEIVRMHAAEILTRRAAYDSDELTIDEAAELSGYHPESLRRLKREGKWSGRRADLPKHERQPPTPVMSIERAPRGGRASLVDRIHDRARTGGSDASP